MKRLIFILTFLLASPIWSADLFLTMGDYRAGIKRACNVDITNTTWKTDSVLNQFLREAIVTVNPSIEGVKASKTFLMVFNKMTYALDTTMVKVSYAYWSRGDTVRYFDRLPREKWSTLVNQFTYGQAEPFLQRPTVYDVTDDSISLFPVPTTQDTVTVIGALKITNITTRDTVSAIPQKYRVAIMKWAAYLAAVSCQHPLAGALKSEADSSIARMGR